jgi:hypothetical protein
VEGITIVTSSEVDHRGFNILFVLCARATSVKWLIAKAARVE